MTDAWKLWLWASVFLAAGELLVLGKARRMLYLGSVALGGVAAAVVAAAGVHWVVQVGVFAAASLVAVVMLRPAAHRYLREDAARRGDDDERPG